MMSTSSTQQGSAGGAIVAPAAAAPAAAMAAPVPGAASAATTSSSSIAPTQQQQLLSSQQPGSWPHQQPLEKQQQQQYAISGSGGAAPHYSLPEMATHAYGADAIHHRYSIRVTEGATSIGRVHQQQQAAPAALQPASITASLPSASSSFKGLPAVDKMGAHTSSSAAFVPPITTTTSQSHAHGSDLNSSSAALASSSAMPAPITQSLPQQPVFHPQVLATSAAPPAITQTMFETRAQPPLASTGMPTARLGVQHHGAGLDTGAIAQPTTTTTTSSSTSSMSSNFATMNPIAPTALGAGATGLTHEHGRIASGTVPVTAYTDSERERQLHATDKQYPKDELHRDTYLDKHEQRGTTAAAATGVQSQYYTEQPAMQPPSTTTSTTGTAAGLGLGTRSATGLVHHHGGGMFCHNKAAAVSTAGMTKEEKKRHKAMLKEERKREKLALKQHKQQEKLRLREEKRRAKEQRTAHEHAQKTRTASYQAQRDATSQRIATDMIKWDTLHAQSAPVGRYNESSEDVLPFTHENIGLFVAVGRGMNLVEGKEAKADAYVKIQLLGRGPLDGKEQVYATHKSEVVKNNANPQWLYHVDDTPHLLGAADSNMDWLKTATLRIEIWDHDTLSRDDLLGWIEWPLSQVDNQIVRGDFQLNLPNTSPIYSGLSTARDSASRKSKVMHQPGTIFVEIRYRSPFAFAGMRRGSATAATQQQHIMMAQQGRTASAPHLQSGAGLGDHSTISSSTSGGATATALPHRSSSGDELKRRSLEKRDTIYDLNHTSRSTIQPTAGMILQPLPSYTTAAPTTSWAPAPAPAPSGLALSQQPGAHRTSSLLEVSAAQHAVPMPAMVQSFPSHGSPKFFFKEEKAKDAKESLPSYTHPATIHTATTTQPAPSFDMKPDARGASFKHVTVDAVQPTRRSSDLGSGLGSGSSSFGSESFYTKPASAEQYTLLQQQPLTLTQQLMATSDAGLAAKPYQQHHLPTSAASWAQEYQPQPATGSKLGELFTAPQQPQPLAATSAQPVGSINMAAPPRHVF